MIPETEPVRASPTVMLPRTATEPPQSFVRPVERAESLAPYLAPVLIGLAYFLVTFNSHYSSFLYDEGQFLQAMRDHTLAFFPGYIGFLWAARSLSTVFSPAASLQFIASLFGAASVAFFWLWMRRLQLSTLLSALGTAVFATGVYQLYNSSVGVTYPVEPFGYLLTGYLCDRAREKKNSLFAAGAVLALCGAVRQTTPVFLLPLFLYCCWRARMFRPVVLFAGLCLIWFVPTIVGYGGPHGMVSTARTEVDGAVMPSTVLKSPRLAGVNLLRFVIYLLYGAHFLLLFAVRQISRFELIWIVPGAVFFALFYVAWPGYVLGVLAVIVLMAVKSVTRLRQPLAAVILAGAVLINCVQFYVVRPIEHPTGMPQAIAIAYAFQYNKAAIVEKFQKRLKELAP